MKITCLIFFFLVTLTTQAQLTFVSGGRTVSVSQNKATYHVSGQKWSIYVNDQRKALSIALNASSVPMEVAHESVLIISLIKRQGYYHLKMHQRPEIGLLDYRSVKTLIINRIIEGAYLE